MARAFNLRLSPRSSGFDTRSFRVEFSVDKVSLRLVLLLVLQFAQPILFDHSRIYFLSSETDDLIQTFIGVVQTLRPGLHVSHFLRRARWGDERHRTTLIHMCAGIRISLSSDIQRVGAEGICGDHVNVRHRNEDGDKCVWEQYTWVFPTANMMPLRARPRKWLTCEPGLNPCNT
jgi:hypothetical protein